MTQVCIAQGIEKGPTRDGLWGIRGNIKGMMRLGRLFIKGVVHIKIS